VSEPAQVVTTAPATPRALEWIDPQRVLTATYVPARADAGATPPEDVAALTAEARRPRRWPALLAPIALVVLVLVEAAVLAGLGLWWLVVLVVGDVQDVGVALFLIGFTLAVAAGLAAGGRALLHGRRGARAPVVTWQLLQGATAVAVLQGTATSPAGETTLWLARLAILVAAAIVVLMLSRPVVHATT